MDNTDNTLTPAYTSWKTFVGLIENCKANNIPGRIDASVLRKLSGTVQNQLTASMRSLTLITGDGTPLEAFRELVVTYKTEQWKATLAKVIQAAYEPILGKDFDVKTATPAQLRERFKTGGGIQGDTINRAIRFYLSGLKDAGVTFSPRLQLRQRVPRAAGPKKPSIRPKSESKEIRTDGDTDGFLPPEGTFEIPLRIIGEDGAVFISQTITIDKWKKVAQYVEMVITIRQNQGDNAQL